MIKDTTGITLIFKTTPPSGSNKMLEQELGKLSPVAINIFLFKDRAHILVPMDADSREVKI